MSLSQAVCGEGTSYADWCCYLFPWQCLLWPRSSSVIHTRQPFGFVSKLTTSSSSEQCFIFLRKDRGPPQHRYLWHPDSLPLPQIFLKISIFFLPPSLCSLIPKSSQLEWPLNQFPWFIWSPTVLISVISSFFSVSLSLCWLFCDPSI